MQGGNMRAMIGSGVVLLSVLGNVTDAAGVSDAVLAGNRGLSPIIIPIILGSSHPCWDC
jgi:hypothetical protein